METPATTARAELVELHPRGVVPPVLFRMVITFAAICARERNEHSVSLLAGHRIPSLRWRERRLRRDFRDDARPNSSAAFTDGEAEALLHGNRGNQLDFHDRVVTRHDHLDALLQFD